MILAEDEIGLGQDHAGIIVLRGSRAWNAARRRAADPGPTCSTSHRRRNRVDLLSMVGAGSRGRRAARRRAAHSRGCGSPRRRRRARRRHGRGLRRLSALHRPRLPRRALAPSPQWLRSRLDARRDAADLQRRRRDELRHARAGGAHCTRSIAAKLAGGRIVVRRARPDEKLRTLDGTLEASWRLGRSHDHRRREPVALGGDHGRRGERGLGGHDRGAAGGREFRAARHLRTSERLGCAPPARIAGRRASTRMSPSRRRSSRAACSSISPGRAMTAGAPTSTRGFPSVLSSLPTRARQRARRARGARARAA